MLNKEMILRDMQNSLNEYTVIIEECENADTIAFYKGSIKVLENFLYCISNGLYNE